MGFTLFTPLDCLQQPEFAQEITSGIHKKPIRGKG